MNDLLTQTELLGIFQNLQAKQILEIATVCQFWATLVQDDGLWKSKCISDREINFNSPSMTWRQLYFQVCSVLIFPTHTQLGRSFFQNNVPSSWWDRRSPYIGHVPLCV